MLLISAARVVPTLPSSTAMLEQLRAWEAGGNAGEASDRAQRSGAVASAAAQRSAIDLFRTLWLRVVGDNCTVEDEEVHCMFEIALRSGLSELVADVTKHVAHLAAVDVLTPGNAELLADCWPELSSAAQQAIGLMISEIPATGALGPSGTRVRHVVCAIATCRADIRTLAWRPDLVGTGGCKCNTTSFLPIKTSAPCLLAFHAV